MSDQIETLLSRYFAKLRPNPPMPAEARLIAALDAADAERSPVWRFGAGRGSRALAGGMAALAVIAIAGSLALRGMNGGGSQAGGAGANKSQQAGGTPSESQMASGTAAATGPTPLSSGSPAHSAGASSAAPGTPGTFTVTGTMTTVDNGMATLLLDGRVLIVGSAADSPEIYDPETGQFSKTGEGIKGGDFGSATRLADGRVLFVGGNDDHTTFSTAQIYDPATGKFTATGSLHQGRTGHTATLLADGRVLIAGGDTFNYAAQPLVIAAAYDPGTAGQGKNPRTSTGPDMLASAEIYDPKTGKFSPTGSMTTGRSYAGSLSVPLTWKGLGQSQVLIVSFP